MRGAAGVFIGLPLLDIMLDDNGEALAGGGALPRRYVLTFGGFSLRTDKDSSPDGFVPNIVGPGYDLKTALAPLSGVHDDVSVVSGLSIPMDIATHNPGPGGGSGFHHHMPCLLCGWRSFGTDFVNATFPDSSSDQLVADAIGTTTLFPSLTYRVQAASYIIAQTNSTFLTMSWRKSGSGNAAAIQPVVSPRQAYETLFTGFTPDDPSEAAKKAREVLRRKSVLDLVDRRMDGMLAGLGAFDRQRLERHLEAIRKLEQLLDATDPTSSNPACELPPHPGDDPPIGSSQQHDFPGDYNVNSAWSDEELRAQVFTDLVHMALVCDLTRVASLMYTQVQSNINCYPISGHSWVFHSLHHHGGTTAKLNDMIAWHVKHFAALVAKLRDTPEGAGRLLDQCAVAFMCEGGNGVAASNDATEWSHSTQGMAMLIAGGGLRAGEHIPAPNKHPANVLLTLMHATGVTAPQLGEIAGTMPELIS